MLALSWRSWYAAADQHRVGPAWLQLVWTLVFALVIAACFTVLGFGIRARNGGDWRHAGMWLHLYGVNLVISLCVAYTIHALHVLSVPLFGRERLRRLKGPKRGFFYAGVPMLGVAIGLPLAIRLVDGAGVAWFRAVDANMIVGSLLISMVISFVFYQFFNAKARQVEAEKRASEARLRLLQGQIEPHFLFNTLANVQALIDVDSTKAKAMLESFTDYLRSSLTALRTGEASLDSEIALVHAYLSLLKTRMEDRLRFDITADPTLRDARLPALCLQPLVENAIHHGLEPKIEGGHIGISTRRDGKHLVLEVVDDGLGLAAASGRRKGAGMALANLRERLLAMYGPAATLTLDDAAPGTRATLRLPLETD